MSSYIMPDGSIGDMYDCMRFVEANYPKGEFLHDVVMEYNDPEDYHDLTLKEFEAMYHGYVCESIVEDPEFLWERFGIRMVER